MERSNSGLRTLIVETHTAAQKGDPFAYANAAALPKFSPSRFSHFIAQIDDGVARAAKAAEPPILHFRAKYSNPRLPVWVAMEYASFGDVTTYYEGLDAALQRKIGDVFSAWPSGLVNFPKCRLPRWASLPAGNPSRSGSSDSDWHLQRGG